MSADWEVALDAQLDAWLFYNGEQGQAFLSGYAKSVESIYADERYSQHTRTMGRVLPRVLWGADPIFVTREMCDLLEAAWPSFQPEALTVEDLLIPNGFVWLAKPMYTHDVHGKRLAHRAIAWYSVTATDTGSPGIVLYSFAGPDDHDDYTETTTGRQRMPTGSAPALTFMTALWFGRGWLEPDFDVNYAPGEYDKDMAETANDEMAHFTSALWRLLNQRIAIGLKAMPSRAARKRFTRATKTDPKYITVVTLRRPKHLGADVEHRSVEWSHRWLVSGHWRWQPYKDGVVKQVWISPYIKGPDDAPLVIRGARVFRLAR